ncbi:glucose 1-dehydrogenase [Thermoactinomyces sp. CICC 10522]|uniref:glucose 1-dehydrogenase n=1 Tax=Thermoactinomyces sp. CICC 10522 TaxID=2767427 RepID=UPI0018DDA5E8|nr:glucose 1-dehydrogenase [Thermoactinomyces sp. CICC 10522]MBH8605409.1 glucose 1-dehydrogenase [Thermoactinomyces sp. CICC 10522]
MEPFVGKVALVTGGGSGIGRATSLAFAKKGAKVVIAGRTREKIVETQEMIKNLGGEAIAVQADVSAEEQVREMIQTTIDQFGRINFACNAAGIGGKLAPTADVTEEDFDRTLAINLKGVWLCMKYQIRQMLKQGSGAIVNISSINGLDGTPNAAIYSASKSGVVSLTKSAALEYAKSNIRINAICPGAVHTPMLEQVFNITGVTPSQYESKIPMNRIGDPNDIAHSVTWLCSDETSYITGHIMVIDGGVSAG